MIDVLERAERLAERFAARATEHDLEGSFPKGDVEDLRAEGFLGLLVPERLGGMGAAFEDYVRVAMALARGNAATALLFNMHAAVTGGLAGVSDALARGLGATEDFFEARDRALGAAVEGSMYGVAISEREVGSRLSRLRSTYRAEDGGYRIWGSKWPCSGAGYLDGYLVAARREGSPEEAPVVSYFLVPAGPGIAVEESWDVLGMRATVSHALHLDVQVSAEALLGGEGLVLPLAEAMPQWLVASYAAVYVGLGRAAVDEAARYLSARAVGGERGALARLGAVRGRVGRAEAQVEAAALAVIEAGRRVDARPGDVETNRWLYRAKLLSGDAAMDAVRSLTEACGLGALQRGSAMERIFRDAPFGALMPPTSDVAADWLGGAALGTSEGGLTPW